MKFIAGLLQRLTSSGTESPPPATPFNNQSPSKSAQHEVQSLVSVGDLAACLEYYDGYVRQAAVLRIAALKDPSFLPYLVERLNDWVPQVMQSAREAIMNLLPEAPSGAILSLLPRVAALRNAQRWQHAAWLAEFEHEVVRLVPAAELEARIQSTDTRVSRACFDLLDRHALLATTQLIALGLRSRHDIVVSRRAAELIFRIAPELQPAWYDIALQSRFGQVRAHAARCLLRDCSEPDQRELAAGLLLHPQTSIREAAGAFLRPSVFDVRSFYRNVLLTPNAPIGDIRASLSALGGLREAADGVLVKSFTTHPAPALRVAAYSAWLRIAERDKDLIAAQALADEAPSVTRYALQLVRRYGAFIPFTAVRDSLLPRREYYRLLQFGELEKWNALESIARVALAERHADQMTEELGARLANWMGTAGRSFTRPSADQVQFLLESSTLATLQTITPGVTIRSFVQYELASVLGTSRS